MIIYAANSKKPVKVPAPHDQDAILIYGFTYKPPAWQAGKIYRKDLHVVIPTVENGFYYIVNSNGTSSGTEPVTWPTIAGSTVTDGTVEWKAVEYNLYLASNETITASAWTVTGAVPIANETFTATGDATAKFGPIPSGVTTFTITNHITISSGEEDDRSMIIKVAER